MQNIVFGRVDVGGGRERERTTPNFWFWETKCMKDEGQQEKHQLCSMRIVRCTSKYREKHLTHFDSISTSGKQSLKTLSVCAWCALHDSTIIMSWQYNQIKNSSTSSTVAAWCLDVVPFANGRKVAAIRKFVISKNDTVSVVCIRQEVSFPSVVDTQWLRCHRSSPIHLFYSALELIRIKYFIFSYSMEVLVRLRYCSQRSHP